MEKTVKKRKTTLEKIQNSFEIKESINLESIKKSEELYNVILETECWIWKKYKDRDGYGVSNDENNYPTQAHRLSYRLFIGEIPNGGIVAHYCDTPDCVNPNHLFLTTHSGNNKDRNFKNRSATGLRNGMYTKPETRSYGNSKASSLWKITYPNGRTEELKNLENWSH